MKNWLQKLFTRRYKSRCTAPIKRRPKGIQWEKKRQALLKMLLALSFERREVTLSSGQVSDFYIDCKQAALTGRGHYLIAYLFYELLRQVDDTAEQTHLGVGGLMLGAAPLASALSMHAYSVGKELNAIYVRKEVKGHGTDAYLEGAGAVPIGSKVLVVEDVVTTGNSTIMAVERLRAHGYVVDTVVALVDREAGGRQALKAAGLQLYSLFDLSNFN